MCVRNQEMVFNKVKELQLKNKFHFSWPILFLILTSMKCKILCQHIYVKFCHVWIECFFLDRNSFHLKDISTSKSKSLNTWMFLLLISNYAALPWIHDKLLRKKPASLTVSGRGRSQDFWDFWGGSNFTSGKTIHSNLWTDLQIIS